MAALAPSVARVRLTSLSRGGVFGCPMQASHQLPLRPHGRPSLRPTLSLPLAAPAATAQRAAFASSPVLAKRRRYKPRDNNPLRGVSSIRRSGPREFLSVSDAPLPRPVGDAAFSREAAVAAARPDVNPDHGLWQFFYDGQVAQVPTKDAAFGRAWTVEELRRKSWDDLHRLWWVCVKERNRIATASLARKIYRLGFGDFEADERDTAVRKTMRGIKHVLTERFYTWEDAVDLAQADPEIDTSGQGPAFQPLAYLEDAEGAEKDGGVVQASHDPAADVPSSSEQRVPLK